MNTPPFDQPGPITPGVSPLPAPVTNATPRWRRFVLPVVGGIVLAVVGFGAGYAVANATSSPSTATGGGGQGFGPGASGRPRGGFGGTTTGTVGSISADQMTIATGSGGSKIVLLTPTTTVTEVTSATKAVTDIASGTNVTVIGTANPDGSVTATSVVIGDLGGFGRGGRGGDNGSPSPSTAP